MLEIKSLAKEFGGVRAIENVSFSVAAGEMVGVIGPNGSGKSTLVNLITGFYAPSAGDVLLDKRSIAGRPPASIRRDGIVRTFQNMRLVNEMTVLENALAGTYLDNIEGGGLLLNGIRSIFGSPRSRANSARCLANARRALELVGLQDKQQMRVGNLSYGDQKRLEIARALAIRPGVLILDEPTAGMTELEAEELIGFTAALRTDADQPMCIMLVEHRLELIMQVSDRIVVLDGGRLIADGPPDVVGSDADVRRIYVGGE